MKLYRVRKLKETGAIMKKFICFVIFFIFLITICSCAVEEKCKILVVNTAQYNDTAFRHSYDVNNNTVISTEEQKKNEKKTVTFDDKQYNLIYSETITYITNDTVIDEYLVEGTNSQGKVLLLPNGEIYAILGIPLVKIDIEITADASTVRKTVEEYFKEEFDFSTFEFCDITRSSPDTSEEFGMYTFVWYNKIGDIRTCQTLKMCVGQDGEISVLWMKYRDNRKFENISNNVTISDFSEAIEKKIKSIYGDKLIGYDIYSSVITHYCGGNCIDCTIGVHYKINSMEFSEACQLLVVLD